MESALIQGNGIDLTISSGTPSTDALRVLCKIIDDFEVRVANGLTTSAIAGGGDEIVVIESGDNPHVLHKFTLEAGTDIDAQTYVVTYEGFAATVADLP